MNRPTDPHRRRPAGQRRLRLPLALIALAGCGGALGLVLQPAATPLSAPGGERIAFSYCRDGSTLNCVVDGDTFRMDGARIRIADIDTPETRPARCPREATLGAAATRRLHTLLNAGVVALHPIDRDTDRYGRKLRRVTVDGRGVGDTLVAEGLARPYRGRRMGWCD